MSEEAEKVSELLKHYGKGNNGPEKITNDPLETLASTH